MDVQVEHLEGHAAQLTVKVESEKTADAKKQAARRLAKKIRIPGFRPGKAPYHVIVNMLGEAALLEEVADQLGQEVYRSALEESELRPAAPGEFIDYKEENGELTFTFKIPKAPEINLKDYRSIRIPLEVKPVTDDIVNEALESMREQKALAEAVSRPAKLGDEIEAELHVTWWHEEDHDHDHEAAEESESDEVVLDVESEEDHDHDHEAAEESESDEVVLDEEYDEEDDDHSHGHEHVLINENEAVVVLREPDDKRDMLPGFSAHLVGLNEGESISFSLDLPEDFEDESLAGQTVNVEVTVKQVRSRTLPELNDTFAATMSNGETETLLELRMKTREQLEETAQQIAEDELFETFFKQVVEQAECSFHEVDVQGYLDSMLQSMDKMLQERMGMGLKDYQRISGQSEADMRAERREDAIQRLKRDLTMVELLDTEKIRVAQATIDTEIDKAVAQFGEQAEQFRRFFDTPQAREDIATRLLSKALVKRVVEIAQGNEPPIETEEDTVQDTEEEAEETA